MTRPKPEALHVFREMPVFGGLENQALLFLLDRTRELYLPKEAYLFKEGEHAVSMYVITQGTIGVYKELEDESYCLKKMGRGDCLGEMALMDFYPRSAAAKALEACRVLEIKAKALHELRKTDLESFTLIQMNLAREVCRRLRRADNLLFRAKVKTDHFEDTVKFLMP